MALEAIGTKLVMDALRSRLIEIDRAWAEIEPRYNKARQELERLGNDLGRLREERDQLTDVLRRYDVRLQTNSSAAITPKDGPTFSVIALLRAQPGQAMDYEQLVKELVAAMEAGRIATNSTSEPRKLIASTIGNMIRAGHVTKTGDVVKLAELKPGSAG